MKPRYTMHKMYDVLTTWVSWWEGRHNHIIRFTNCEEMLNLGMLAQGNIVIQADQSYRKIRHIDI